MDKSGISRRAKPRAERRSFLSLARQATEGAIASLRTRPDEPQPGQNGNVSHLLATNLPPQTDLVTPLNGSVDHVPNGNGALMPQNGDGHQLKAWALAASAAPGAVGMLAVSSETGVGLQATNFGGGVGAWGSSTAGTGVLGQSGTGAAVVGQASGASPGVAGSSVAGPGVRGSSGSGPGIEGFANASSPGVVGHGTAGRSGVSGSASDGVAIHGSASGAGVGVRGDSNVGSGVYGRSSAGTGVDGRGSTGGLFVATSGDGMLLGGGTGVNGASGSGPGVSGTSLSGVGVTGASETGPGIRGTAHAPTGIGVIAQNDRGGLGLDVIGKVRFRSAGVATVPSGADSISIPAPVNPATSIVLITLLADPGDRVAWVTVGAGVFTVNLRRSSGPPAHKPIPFSWLAIERFST